MDNRVKKVAFVRNYWTGGGLEMALLNAGALLNQDLGITPVLIINSKPEKDLGSMELIDLGIGKVGDFPIKGNLVNTSKYIYQLATYYLSLRKYVPWSDFDFVVALDPEIAFMLKKLCKNKPVVMWLHGSVRVLTTMGLWPLIRAGLKRCDSIIALNESMKNEIAEIYPPAVTKTFVIHNAVTIQPLGGVHNVTVKKIVYVGRLSNREKRLERLLKSFSYFWQSHSDWKLCLVGDGPDREKLISLISELDLTGEVELAGWQENPWKYIRDTGGASFLALTSDYEGFPMVLCEALINQLPVVALNCPVGPSEIVQNGVNGLLVPFGSQEEETIQNLVKAFSSIADGVVKFNENELPASVARYLPPSVEKQWKDFLEGIC
ncbi:MAG: glycosyltransferase family 4 protein [Acetomicrobium flavidum]|uniref:glycosyltransferase n=1 Tax=Bacteria TaxID=2 RepID=UPI000D314C2C|nr:glycosyltransferase [Coprothermobacter proteolyticus]NLG95380.1 glycosyltransferase family 4 protein [Acetomicrobium flavidum]